VTSDTGSLLEHVKYEDRAVCDKTSGVFKEENKHKQDIRVTQQPVVEI